MEQGASKIALMLAFALLLGIAITAFNPHYRQAFLSIAKGQPQESPIWKSNLDYYPDIVLPGMPPWKPAPAVDGYAVQSATRSAAAHP
ncbi:MAG: hypothetical protein AB7V14_08820 [Kiritimatiellia bacterium]